MYAFPPDGLFDLRDTSWTWFAYACTVFSCLQFGAGIWHFVRRWNARLCTTWTAISWFAVAGIDAALLWTVVVYWAPPHFAWFLILFALPTAMVVWLQCLEAISRQRDPTNKSIPRRGLLDAIGIYGVVGFLVAIFPGHGHHVESSRRTQCRNNLKQLGLTFHNWHDEHMRLPDSQFSKADEPPRSWRVELFPYVNDQKQRPKYDRSRAWDTSPNLDLASQQVKEYLCPSIPIPQQANSAGQLYTAYALLIGPQTAFPDGKGGILRDFKDGTSNTALIVEACGQQIIWTEPRDIQVTDENIGINLPSSIKFRSPAILSSYHQGGAHLLLADGSVRFIRDQIDPSVLRALTTASNNDPVGDY